MGANSQSRLVQNLFSFIFVFIFLYPFVILLLQVKSLQWADNEELLWAFKNSLMQSVLAATGATVFGFIFSFGLIRWHRLWLDFLFLFPIFTPTIFVLLFFLQTIEPFPRNNWGVSFIHTFIYMGMVAVSFKRSQLSKWTNWAQQAQVMGLSSKRFIWLTISSLRSEFFANWNYVFITALTSFNIPLIMGGSHGTNLEVLIYEKLRIDGDWSQALSITIVQVLVVAVFSLLFFSMQKIFLQPLPDLKFKNSRTNEDQWSTLTRKWLGNSTVAGIGLVIYLFFAGSLVYGMIASLAMPGMEDYLRSVADYFLNTFSLALFSGVLAVMGLLMYAFLWPQLYLQKFFQVYLPPSSVLLGIAAFFWGGPQSGWSLQIKYLAVTFLLGFPFLSKLAWESELQKLKPQWQVASTMGLSHWKWVGTIFWPQLFPKICDLAFLQSVWIAGDFALYKMVVNQDRTIGSYMATLMSSYRIDAAMAVGVYILVTITLLYIFWMGLKKICQKLLV